MAEVRDPSPEPLNIPERNEKEILPSGPMSVVFEILGTDNIDYQTVPETFSRPLKMARLREDDDIREKLTNFIKMTREIYPELPEEKELSEEQKEQFKEQLKIINSLESIINKTITLPGDGGTGKAPIDREHLIEIFSSFHRLYEPLKQNPDVAVLKKIIASFSFIPEQLREYAYQLLSDLDLPQESFFEIGKEIKDESIKMDYFCCLASLGKISEEESLRFAESISDPYFKNNLFFSIGRQYVTDFFTRNIFGEEFNNEQVEEFFQQFMVKFKRIQNENIRDLLLAEANYFLNACHYFQLSARIIPEIKNKELKESSEALFKLITNKELTFEEAIELTSKIEDEAIRTQALDLILKRYKPTEINENFPKILAIFNTIHKKNNRSHLTNSFPQLKEMS